MKLSLIRCARFQTVSKLFQPIVTSPKKFDLSTDTNNKVSSCSQKLMLKAGIIHPAHNGFFHLLPLGVRALNKLTALVEYEMENYLNAQRISIPSLTSGDLWKLTGRMELAGVELFKLNDRHKKEFILAPTYEEAIANLIATIPLISHRSLPLLLYQISNKFRDEMRPRFGLIRSKEFVMKDLYSFDINHESAARTYEKVCDTYEKILKKIGIDFCKVAGDTGLMGGSYSHEYHYVANIGDDTFKVCDVCNSSWNENLFKNENVTDDVCKECGSSSLKQHKGIEVGHTFMLGTKYSSVLGAQFSNKSQERQDLFMGCYGLGLSRIIGATLEVLSTVNELRWPSAIVPYSVVIIKPKIGGKECDIGETLLNDLCHSLNSIEYIKDDILVDDRMHLNIGRRINEAKLTGYPNIVVIGKAALKEPPMFEYHNLSQNKMTDLTLECLVDEIKNNCYYNKDTDFYVNTEVAARSF